MRLSNVIEYVNGQLVKDGEFEVLEYCTSKCEKRFLTFLENVKYIDKINSNATCIITTEQIYKELPRYVKGIVLAKEPKKEFVTLHNILSKTEQYAGKRFKTVIGEACDISPLAYIADENVIIGNNVKIAPFVSIRENVSIGDGCKIYENCVIGGQSFNYVKTNEGKNIGMIDCGKVILEEDVEVCSNCHIASGPLPTDITKLGKNVKLDAFIHIGHGTKIGERTLIPAGAQISGNVSIGTDAWIGVNATIANRITIGNKGRVSLGSVVTKDVEENQTVTGNFAIAHDLFMSNLKESVKKKE